jgi:hypothetical protein
MAEAADGLPKPPMDGSAVSEARGETDGHG